MNLKRPAARNEKPTDANATPQTVASESFSSTNKTPSNAIGAPISDNHFEESSLGSITDSILRFLKGLNILLNSGKSEAYLC